jgi:Uma2 family endonuclease
MLAELRLPEPGTDELVRIPMSYDEFLDWDSDIPRRVRAEWAHGEAILMNAPLLRHRELQGRLYELFRSALPSTTGYFEPETRTGVSQREPDLVVVARKPNNGQYIDDSPLIVVEIMSLSTRDEDRHVEPVEYATFGARQYWIVDPEGQPSIEVQENRGGTWAQIAKVDAKHQTADIDVPGHGTVHLTYSTIFAD